MTSTGTLSELLAEEDLQYLAAKGYEFEAARADGFVCVLIRGFTLSTAYSPSSTDLLLRLPLNFPMARPDMFWTFPYVKLPSGAYPQAADQFDVEFEGRRWQRWSRHSEASQWRPGTDNLKTYLGTIRRELLKGI
jgi:hypothetical protein